MSETSPSNAGTYIYCVAHTQPFENGGSPFTAPGIGEGAVRLVTYDDLEAAALLDVLEPLAVATQMNKNLGDLMLLNAAFLVDKSQEEAFGAQVQALGEAQAGRLIFDYVGPLPPYNFVDIRLNWEEEPVG